MATSWWTHPEIATRLNKVVSAQRDKMLADPKAVDLQVSFLEGCRTLLTQSESIVHGPGAHTMWETIWPLAVHPRKELAEVAQLCLCRLTWTKRSFRGASNSNNNNSNNNSNNNNNSNAEFKSVPGAEDAITTACMQLLELNGKKGALAQQAQLQQSRLLLLSKRLATFGRSAVADSTQRSGGRGPAGGGIVVLPIALMLRTLEPLALPERRSSGSSRSPVPAAVTVGALDLAADLVAVGRSAILPHTATYRRWIEVLIGRPLLSQWRSSGAICELISEIARSAPSMLMDSHLLDRLTPWLLAPLERGLEDEETLPVSEGTAMPVPAAPQGKKRKRQAAAAAAAAAAAEAANKVPSIPPSVVRHLTAVAVEALAALLRTVGRRLKGDQVASVAERLVRTLWLGLVAPSADRAGAGGDAVADPSLAASFLCRKGRVVLAMIDAMDAMQEFGRPGGSPLAPSLLSGFLGLLSVIAATTVSTTRARRGGITEDVRQRVLEVRTKWLSGWNRPAPLTSTLLGGPSSDSISINWPAPVQQIVSDAAVPVVGTAAEETDEDDEEMADVSGAAPLEALAKAPETAKATSETVAETIPPAAASTAPAVAEAPAAAAAVPATLMPGAAAEAEAVLSPAPVRAALSPAPAATIVTATSIATGIVAAEATTPLQVETPATAATSTATATAAAAASAKADVVPATDAIASAAEPSAGGSAGGRGILDLFDFDEREISPLPELCMDSPSEDER